MKQYPWDPNAKPPQALTIEIEEMYNSSHRVTNQTDGQAICSTNGWWGSNLTPNPPQIFESAFKTLTVLPWIMLMKKVKKSIKYSVNAVWTFLAFKKLISFWLADGEQIVFGFDANEDIRGNTINAWQTKWHLSGSLTCLHGPPNVATWQSNSCNVPIDAFWSTFGLDITNGGMMGFGSVDLGSANHRILWLDIDKESVFGFCPPSPQKQPNN